ncbi:MAG: hypothetical protein JNK45_11805 [Myxococcales bacterium]|nr:hypothetical protein [Myxococcales bacterium]
MHRIALALSSLLCFAPIACDSATSGADAKSGDAADHSAVMQKLVGTWVAQGESGEIYELTATRFKSTYPKIEGGKPMEGPVKIVKVDGNEITLSQSLDLGDGKMMPADDQIVTIVDGDTIERRNAKKKSGGTFKRKQ